MGFLSCPTCRVCKQKIKATETKDKLQAVTCAGTVAKACMTPGTKALAEAAIPKLTPVGTVVTVGSAAWTTRQGLRRGDVNKITKGTIGTLGSMGGGYYGAAAGAWFGSAVCPGLGTIIGGAVGGAIGGLGTTQVLDKAFDAGLHGICDKCYEREQAELLQRELHRRELLVRGEMPEEFQLIMMASMAGLFEITRAGAEREARRRNGLR